MNIFWIIGIVAIVLVFLIALTIAGLGQLKVRRFRKIKQINKEKLEQLLQEHPWKPTPVKLEYELPEGEECYYVKEDIFIDKLSEKQAFRNALPKREVLNFKRNWIFLNGIFNLSHWKSHDPKSATMYVTNRRILFQFKDYNIFFNYPDVDQIAISLFNDGEYSVGYLLYSNTEIYKINCPDFTFFLASRDQWSQINNGGKPNG